MAFSQVRFYERRPPSRLLLIPITLVALVFTMPFLVHWHARILYGSPPATQLFDGLPVAGSLADARDGGFAHCIDFKTTMRCRRTGVMLFAQGPYSAALDLAGGDGIGGFNQLTLWNDHDQDAPIDIALYLERQGWESCRTMRYNAGDQHIFMRKGSPVRISIDISYYGKRRIRIIPEWQAGKPRCQDGPDAA